MTVECLPGSTADAGAAAVRDVFRGLPDRYLGAGSGFDHTWHVRLGDVGQTWEVRCTPQRARVRLGASRRPDVTIATDAATWLRLRAGETNAVEAFSSRRLSVRGDLDLALGFDGLFRLPGGRPPLLRVHDVQTGGLRISTVTMGSGPDVLLLHGLGAGKSSFLDTAAALSGSYRVHALDLPGFGRSSKPARAGYGAPFFARAVLGAMDALGIECAHLVGNSMGGRVAIELALARPERVGGLALLCPAVAFVRRGWHPLVRLMRPELGVLPHRLGRANVEAQFWSMFADRDLVDPSVAELAVDEFERSYGSAGARLAFLASARAIYLDRPFGAGGFYPRLSRLRAPALFVWGTHDQLIPAGFKRHVERWLPAAEQIVLHGCGHAPQIERPQRTNGLVRRFLARVDALGRPRVAARAA